MLRYRRQSKALLLFSYEQLAVYTVLFANDGAAIPKEAGEREAYDDRRASEVSQDG